MQTLIDKKICPTASAQTVSGTSMPGVPFKYLSIPPLAPLSYTLLITMTTRKISGNGTVTQTMYDDVLTPLKIARKQTSHTNMVEKKAIIENYVGSPSA